MLISQNGNLALLKWIVVSHLSWVAPILPVSACYTLRSELWNTPPVSLVCLSGDHTGRVGGDHVLCDGCPFLLQFYLLYLVDNRKYKVWWIVRQQCKLRADKNQVLGQHRYWGSELLEISKNPASWFSPRVRGRITYIVISQVISLHSKVYLRLIFKVIHAWCRIMFSLADLLAK